MKLLQFGTGEGQPSWHGNIDKDGVVHFLIQSFGLGPGQEQLGRRGPAGDLAFGDNGPARRRRRGIVRFFAVSFFFFFFVLPLSYYLGWFTLDLFRSRHSSWVAFTLVFLVFRRTRRRRYCGCRYIRRRLDFVHFHCSAVLLLLLLLLLLWSLPLSQIGVRRIGKENGIVGIVGQFQQHIAGRSVFQTRSRGQDARGILQQQLLDLRRRGTKLNRLEQVGRAAVGGSIVAVVVGFVAVFIRFSTTTTTARRIIDKSFRHPFRLRLGKGGRIPDHGSQPYQIVRLSQSVTFPVLIEQKHEFERP
mmetsp:Transcript_19088/g.52322  ORF Transcript_19088/g.52322 Transcript_19088/m.52322 type:complete len:303 (+) Transcript_19088:565-1473(+)